MPCFWGVTLKNYDCKRSREATHLKVSMLCKWTVEKCKLNLVWKKHVFPQEIANTWFQLITSKFVHPSYPAAFSCNWYLPKKTNITSCDNSSWTSNFSEKIMDPILESSVFSQPFGWSKVFHKQIRSLKLPTHHPKMVERQRLFRCLFWGGL